MKGSGRGFVTPATYDWRLWHPLDIVWMLMAGIDPEYEAHPTKEEA